MDSLLIYFDANLLQYASYMLSDEAFDDILVTGNSESLSAKSIRHGQRWIDDLKALRFILDVDDQLPLIFVTSKLTLDEIKQAPYRKRRG